ncbi:PKHO2 protein, partial [Atractosteus spatula]|nr:PKHO2 protein [Atractosteus spatula]
MSELCSNHLLVFRTGKVKRRKEQVSLRDGKEQKEQPKAVKVPEKAGWIKKSSGKILGTYKDRYIQLERTEILVYDNEDLKNCMEKVDLENYDKCHELRSAFKKRNRLILIRAPKSGSKVHDIKLQTQSPEEKEAWIKALSDGINRAKNKVFDEIKVDESCSLEHVTRSRPKGNHGRRPPTRIHMKEVASVASDGILRLDLDAVDNTPNGNHPVFTDANDINEVGKPTSSDEPTPQKKVLKPPMPPSKENKLSVLTEKEELKEVSPDEPIIKNSAPPAPPKKKPLKPLIKTTASDQPSDTREASGEQEDVKSDNSTHSSQSGDESESDNMRASTTALSGSRENLSEDSGDEDKAEEEMASRLEEEPRTTEKAKEMCFQDADKVASVQQLVQSKRIMQPSPPPVPLKRISKGKFASTGDLLSESAQQSPKETMRELNVSSLNTDMNKLKNQVSWELEKTEELLQKLDEKKTAKGSQGNLPDGLVPQDPSAEEILNEAVEKLRKADEFLKEVQNLKESNSAGKKSKRKSW